MRVRISVLSTVADVKTNLYLSRAQAATVTFYVGRPVDVEIFSLVQDSIYSGRHCTLCVVESEKPSFAAESAAEYTNITHIHHS